MKDSHDIDLAKKEALEAKQDKLYARAINVVRDEIPYLLEDMLTGANDLVKDSYIDYELDLSDLEDELRKYLINLKKDEIEKRQEALSNLSEIPALIGSIVNDVSKQKKEIA